jgi:phosphoribosylanthranilate isomerase
VSVRIKFCGVTRIDDAFAATALGVDAIGMVFTRRSQRFVDLVQAAAIRRVLPPFVAAVALFMDDEPAWIEDVIEVVRPDLLQFHGGETAEFARGFARPYLKAVPMGSIADAAAAAAQHPDAVGILLDSHAAGAVGGSGVAFDWARVPPDMRRPVVLAGGLDASNVARAIALMRPYAVDVSSGIESAPGIKDALKMRAFVDAVRNVTGPAPTANP